MTETGEEYYKGLDFAPLPSQEGFIEIQEDELFKLMDAFHRKQVEAWTDERIKGVISDPDDHHLDYGSMYSGAEMIRDQMLNDLKTD